MDELLPARSTGGYDSAFSRGVVNGQAQTREHWNLRRHHRQL